MFTFAVYKEVLYRRGLIATPKTRGPGAATLDDYASRELDQILADLSPLLATGLMPA